MRSPRRFANEQSINTKFVFNWVYMSLYWIFFGFELFFIGMKYGPYHDRIKGSCYTFDIEPHCPQFKWYWFQFIFYIIWILLLFILPIPLWPYRQDCDCHVIQPLGNQMKNRYLHCNQLLFPLIILFCLIIIETAIAITKTAAWYIIQILIDAFGYVIWFIFVFVPPTIIRQFRHYFFKNNAFDLNEKEIKMLRMHVPFMLIVLCDFLWVLYSIFDEDFNFEVIDGNLQLIFVQILLENVLILEWIHFVIEDLAFDDKKIHSEIEEIRSIIDSERDLRIQSFTTQNDDLLIENKENEEKNEYSDHDSKNHNSAQIGIHEAKKSKEVLANWTILISLFIFCIMSGIFVFQKLLESKSNFQMFHGEYSNFIYCIWIIQPIVSFILFLMIFCSLFQNPKQTKSLSFNILWFPGLIFLAMIVAESIFGFWINQHYFLQIVTDSCGYFIFFLFALLFVRYVFFNENMDDLSECHKTMMRLLIFGYVIVSILFVIRNLKEDLESAKKAVDIFKGDKKLITAVAFIQIILENALIIEWYHVLTHKLSPESCITYPNDFRQRLLSTQEN